MINDFVVDRRPAILGIPIPTFGGGYAVLAGGSDLGELEEIAEHVMLSLKPSAD